MKHFTRLSNTSQLAPLLEMIYSKAIENINKKRSEQSLFTRKQIKTLIYQGYTLDSISNALNQLHDLGLMFFNKITQAWNLVIGRLTCHNEPDYDHYMKLKQDIKQKAVNHNIYLFGAIESRRIIGGNI